MNITNKTILSLNEFTKMMQIANTRIPALITLLGTIVFGIATIILTIFETMQYEWMQFYYIVLIAIIFGIFIFLHIFPKTLAKTISKQNSNIKNGIEYNFVFKENDFQVESITSGQNGIATIEYSSIYDVKKKIDFIIIYISKGQVYLCKYDGFNDNEKDECISKLMTYSRGTRKKY